MEPKFDIRKDPSNLFKHITKIFQNTVNKVLYLC